MKSCTQKQGFGGLKDFNPGHTFRQNLNIINSLERIPQEHFSTQDIFHRIKSQEREKQTHDVFRVEEKGLAFDQ